MFKTKVKRKSTDYIGSTKKAAEKAVVEAVARVQRRAVPLAPVDTGRLRGSIRKEPIRKKLNTVLGVVFTDLAYSLVQERRFGYMSKAAATVRAQLGSIFRRWLKIEYKNDNLR